MIQTYVIRSEAILDRAVQFARNNWRAMAETKHPLTVLFQPESAKRSLQANKYYWAVLRQLEEQAWVEGRQYPSECWHELAKRKFIGCDDLPGGGTMAMSSTTLSTKEFAEYVERVEAWAQVEMGVTLVDVTEFFWRPTK